MEMVWHDPRNLIDAAHNAASIQALIKVWITERHDLDRNNQSHRLPEHRVVYNL